MDLTVQRGVDPHNLVMTVRMQDVEIKGALGTDDPDDLGFDVFLRALNSMPKAEYIRLVATLVEKVEQAAGLTMTAGAPEPK